MPRRKVSSAARPTRCSYAQNELDDLASSRLAREMAARNKFRRDAGRRGTNSVGHASTERARPEIGNRGGTTNQNGNGREDTNALASAESGDASGQDGRAEAVRILQQNGQNEGAADKLRVKMANQGGGFKSTTRPGRWAWVKVPRNGQ